MSDARIGGTIMLTRWQLQEKVDGLYATTLYNPKDAIVSTVSGMHVYKHVKVIILNVKISLLSPKSPYMPTQQILLYFQDFVILIKFYRLIIILASCFVKNCVLLIWLYTYLKIDLFVKKIK